MVYPSVPGTWYAATLAGTVVAAFTLIQLTPGLQLPAWGLALSIVVAAVFMIPVGFVCFSSSFKFTLVCGIDGRGGFFLKDYSGCFGDCHRCVQSSICYVFVS